MKVLTRALLLLFACLPALTEAAEPVPRGPVEILDFKVEPKVINPGETATLSWRTKAAFSCDLQPGIGSVELPSGSTEVSPAATTMYTLTCEGSGGPAPRQAELQVQAPPEVTSISAEPQTVALGSSSRISWTSQNAQRCVFKPGGEEVAANGDRSVTPTATTTYAVTCSGVGPDSTRSVTVTVGKVGIRSFSVQPAGPIGPKQEVTFSWQTEWPSACELTPDVGEVAIPDGSRQVVPGRSQEYTLTCQGFEGPVKASQAVTVKQVKIDSFTANPATTAKPGDVSTLSWTAQDVDSCSITPNGCTSSQDQGSCEVRPDQLTTYTLTCSGQGGPALAQTQVDVQGVPRISGFAGFTDRSWTGPPVELRWTTVYANSCTLNGSQVPVNGTSQAPRWCGSKAYVLKCTGTYGSAEATHYVCWYDDNFCLCDR